MKNQKNYLKNELTQEKAQIQHTTQKYNLAPRDDDTRVGGHMIYVTSRCWRHCTVGSDVELTLPTNITPLACNMQHCTTQMHETLNHKLRMTYTNQAPVGMTQYRSR